MANAEFQQRCRDYFKQADTDGKGSLSIQELSQVLKKSGVNMTQEEVIKIFCELDVNNDREISLEEFMASLCKVSPKDVKESDLRTVFRKFDRDGSGSITIDELKQALADQGYNPEDAVLDMDCDKDGKVNFEEFLASFRANM